MVQKLQKIEFDLTQPHNVTGTLFHDFRSRVVSQEEKKAYFVGWKICCRQCFLTI
jgi:hypothetical protein